jgi:hypothetical protein
VGGCHRGLLAWSRPLRYEKGLDLTSSSSPFNERPIPEIPIRTYIFVMVKLPDPVQPEVTPVSVQVPAIELLFDVPVR